MCRLRVADMWPIWSLTVADIVCGRYFFGRYGLWPIWFVADIVVPLPSNAVLVGLPVSLEHQLVLNLVAQLIYHLESCHHIADALISLHWL